MNEFEKRPRASADVEDARPLRKIVGNDQRHPAAGRRGFHPGRKERLILRREIEHRVLLSVLTHRFDEAVPRRIAQAIPEPHERPHVVSPAGQKDLRHLGVAVAAVLERQHAERHHGVGDDADRADREQHREGLPDTVIPI